MKLSKAPNMRTVVVAIVAFLLIGTALEAFARDVRVYPQDGSAVGGVPVIAGCTAEDLMRATTGVGPILNGPDAGYTTQAGDRIILAPGTYTVVFGCALAATVPGPWIGFHTIPVLLQDLEIISMRGNANTIVTAAAGATGPVFVVQADGVRIGVPDKGMTITSAVTDGILIGDTDSAATAFPAAAGGAADERVSVQGNRIITNAGAGIFVDFTVARAIEDYNITDNVIRGNTESGIVFTDTVTSIRSRRTQAFNISRNEISFNGTGAASYEDGVTFDNEGPIESLIIQNNEIHDNAGNGVTFGNPDLDADGIIVTDIENLRVIGNWIQNNGTALPAGVELYGPGAGIYFGNTGDIDSPVFQGNIDRSGQRGISANYSCGIFIDGATPVAGGTIPAPGLAGSKFFDVVAPATAGVNGVQNVLFENNIISENGNGGFVNGYAAAGYAGGALPFSAGLCAFNTGDFEGAQFLTNEIVRNHGSGVGIFSGDSFTDSLFQDNEIRNNGVATALPESDGVTAIVNRDLDTLTFDHDDIGENYNNGVFLGSVTGQASFITIQNNSRMDKNGLTLAVGLPQGDGFEVSTFDSIDNVTWSGSQANNNGGNGLYLDANGNTLAAAIYGYIAAVNLDDLQTVNVENGIFNANGASAAVGAGSGMFFQGDQVRDITVVNTTANTNDDNGLFAGSTDDILNVTVRGSTMNNNDPNNDITGAGIFLNSAQDMDDMTIEDNEEINGNMIGVHFRIQGQNARNIIVNNNAAINDNVEDGVRVDAVDDANNVQVTNNTLARNGRGIWIRVADRASNIVIEHNAISGSSGTGILLDATNVAVTNNDIRNHETSIDVNKAEDSAFRCNNIVTAPDGDWGVDARDLGPGETIDARENWWGESSGPFDPVGNPNGKGSRVEGPVDYADWLTAPCPNAPATGAIFSILSATVNPLTVNVGGTVQFNAIIENIGTGEGTVKLKLIKINVADGTEEVVKTDTANLSRNDKVTFSANVTFAKAGTFRLQLVAEWDGQKDESTPVTVEVKPGVPTDFISCAAGADGKFDDAEIIAIIDAWVKAVSYLTCGVPTDANVINAIDLWVRGATATTASAGAPMRPLATATKIATLASSVRTVRPGETFTVTVTVDAVDAKDGFSGLLLSQSVPVGWTVRPIEMARAYFKASENKWLWLNARGTVALTYEVSVPANAAPGVYQIAGRAKVAVPSMEAELQPLTVEVLGAPVALAVKSITLSQKPVRNSGAYFVVEGVGIAQTTVHVFSLTGKLVFSQTAQGSVVPFSAASELANGIYLYVVTVQGAGEQTVRSKIQKLVVLR